MFLTRNAASAALDIGNNLAFGHVHENEAAFEVFKILDGAVYGFFEFVFQRLFEFHHRRARAALLAQLFFRNEDNLAVAGADRNITGRDAIQLFASAAASIKILLQFCRHFSCTPD